MMTKLPCPPELWSAFSALLDEALDIPEAGRMRWLASLGAEHAKVQPWLVKVLATGTATRAPGFMSALVADDAMAPEFVAGQLVGPYQLKKRLGSGGMGEVWLASRSDGTLTREVALKLPHIHLLAGVVRRRFERERDILAALSHPRIAHLYDAGVDEAQNPYLAMEWVDGVAINEYCRDAKVSLERRLNLFLQVLDAVGHAHGRLIAHRDLKPSNILVTSEERVKLLDFGIAKLLDGDAQRGATQMTRIGACMATPAYAAPEQLAGEPITVAVDLYALGVILHEMLTGQRPFRDNRKTSAERTDTVRASARIESGHAEYVGGLNAAQLRRALSGDLDAIIAKALEVDPARRYASAEAFAQDIRHSRDHRPISALRISTTTQALKFVRRHWIGVATTAGFLVLLIGGSAGIAWQAVRAEREARRATTIKDFLVDVFRANDPRIAADKPRGEITARALLDASAKRIESSFAQEPATQIELLGVTADIYRELEETQRSNALYARETELAGRYYGVGDLHFIDGLLGQADVADNDGDDVRALALLSQADALIRQAHLETSPIRARWLLIRGESLFGDAAKADEVEASLNASAALFKAVAPRDPHYVEALIDLGALSLEQSHYFASANYYQKAISVAQANLHPEGDLLLPYEGLALTRRRLGDFDGAATAFARGAEIAERTYGRETQRYWSIASDWAQFRYERGERQAALAAFDALLQNLPRGQTEFRNATDAMEAAHVLRKYGYCLAIDGQGARAVQLLEQAQTLLTKSAPHAFDAGRLQLDLGTSYEAAGRMAEARAAFTAALTNWRTQKASGSKLSRALESWGRFLLSQKDPTGAALAFHEALQMSEGHATEAAVLSQAGLAAIAVSSGDARTALSASQNAMDLLGHLEGYYDIRIEPHVWSVRARALSLAGDYESARALARNARDAASAYYASNAETLVEAEGLLRDLPTNASLR
jgi:eukaryotic-like serine/threonine-protein kinase